jgi:ABC-2 type transport system permease protein
MPIYEQTYRRYEARGHLRTIRFWPITREALGLIVAKRAYLGLLALGWIPFLLRLVQVFALTRVPELARVTPLDGRLFGEFLNWQMVPMLLLTTFGGAGLIANDLRTGAILVYLSRPLTRRDYILGKFCVLLALNLSVTLVPGGLLYVLSSALGPEQLLKGSLAWVLPAIVLDSLVLASVVSLVALVTSSLSRSAGVAGLAFFGLMVVFDVVVQILRRFLQQDSVALLSIRGDLRALGDALFGLSEGAMPWGALLVLAMVCLSCVAVLGSRVRAVEIVS